MRKLVRGGVVLATLGLLTACGGSGGGGGGGPGPYGGPDWYVDATFGSDVNSGALAAPFKSITKALGLATNGHTVHVAPGVYDTGNGEVFPIDVTGGVTVLGDEPNKGDGPLATMIRGGGGAPLPFSASIVAAVVLRAGAVLAGFQVFDNEAPTPTTAPYGMFVGESGTTIRNNSIRDSAGGGVYVAAGAGAHTIASNSIVNHGSGPGLNFFAGTGTKVESNVITGNQNGVALSSGAVVDLGGGAAGSAGGNTISCSLQNDIFAAAALTVAAQNNFWDHNPPTTGTASEDLLTTFGATYTTTGAALAAAPCP
jgi:hypothetical protein